MWARNLAFLAICLVGLSWLASSLLRSEQPTMPTSFDAARDKRELRPVLDKIDAEFRQSWAAANLEPAGPADELLLARRLSLTLMGTLPSLEEIRVMQSLDADQRLDWWVSRILEDRRYADYVAERLARAYVGTQNGPFLVYRRRRFVTWLSDELYKNTRYDQLVRQLISDEGLWTDKPAVNFVSVTLDENDDGRPDPIRLAARTSRAFLGMRIDCLQCHDNLRNVQIGDLDQPREGLQSDFHHLAAFFSEAKSSLFGIKDEEREYQTKYLNAEAEKTVAPLPPFLPELVTAEGSRRDQLAAWVTDARNKPFARAIVNRVWALMFGRPLVEPIDDIPLTGELPPGLDTLADDFVEHGYDLRRLIRLIASTEVFQRDSRADFEVTVEHESAWSVFPLTRLRPEQMAGGLIQAASLRTIDANSHIISQVRRFTEENDFIKRYGDTGEDEFEKRAGTIAQRLLLMNGKLVQERTKESLVTNAATRIGMLASTDQRAIETAYLVLLTRYPAKAEEEHFLKLLAGSRASQRSQHMEDLYWVLINSTEFSWNH